MIQYNLITIGYDENDKKEKHTTPCTDNEALYYMNSKAISSYCKALHSGFKGKKTYKVPFDRNFAYQKVKVIFS